MTQAGLILNRINTGFIAVLVGFTSTVALIYQAAINLGGDIQMVSSWLLALGLGMGITSIGLSLYYRIPILIAWSTPGAALLISSTQGFTIHQATGAFLFSAALITLSGVTGWFEKVMNRVPQPIANAMLAGILINFGINTFNLMDQQIALVSSMLLTYLLCKYLLPRYTMLAVLLIGFTTAWLLKLIEIPELQWQISTLHYIQPEWSIAAFISIGLPLFVVTMASQNIPGIAVLKAHGYQAPVSSTMTVTGAANLLLAPFGGFAINLAAITAAICMTENADPISKQRYWTSVAAGVFYILMGLGAVTLMTLFDALPAALILALAGIALFSTIGNSLQLALHDVRYREAALITFMVTASNLEIWNIGSPLWGVVAGGITLLIQRWLRSLPPTQR
ncbi:MAG: benzoate/H(+) symporter BenE family transporter [Aliivibrio sp.]|uniref:benzoate/H(+) symporter BenE family transporter n=1 Tax=Aliivibrio sp. TaxID=1872443 RepID=UPI001A522913|nr:benzoate/H(+) symporter BenE family transporter [Aliivibrio sp.]